MAKNLAKRFWVYHPRLQPWTRAFVSEVATHGGLWVASLVYQHTVGSGENQGIVLDAHHEPGTSEKEAMDGLERWIGAEFGDGVRFRALDPDEPDMR